MEYQANLQPGTTSTPDFVQAMNAAPGAQAALQSNQNAAQAGQLANQQAAAMNPLRLQAAQRESELAQVQHPFDIENAKQNQDILRRTQAINLASPVVQGVLDTVIAPLQKNGANIDLVNDEIERITPMLAKDPRTANFFHEGMTPEEVHAGLKSIAIAGQGFKDYQDKQTEIQKQRMIEDAANARNALTESMKHTTEQEKTAADLKKADIEKEWQIKKAQIISGGRTEVANIKKTGSSEDIQKSKAALIGKLLTSGMTNDVDEAKGMVERMFDDADTNQAPSNGGGGGKRFTFKNGAVVPK